MGRHDELVDGLGGRTGGVFPDLLLRRPRQEAVRGHRGVYHERVVAADEDEVRLGNRMA